MLNARIYRFDINCTPISGIELNTGCCQLYCIRAPYTQAITHFGGDGSFEMTRMA
jgi:hypothetical protein